MDIKIVVVEQAIKWLVGGEPFKIITRMVADLMNKDMTNDEKRDAVKRVVMPLVSGIGQFLLSTAIAFAVDKLKEEVANA